MIQDVNITPMFTVCQDCKRLYTGVLHDLEVATMMSRTPLLVSGEICGPLVVLRKVGLSRACCRAVCVLVDVVRSRGRGVATLSGVRMSRSRGLVSGFHRGLKFNASCLEKKVTLCASLVAAV